MSGVSISEPMWGSTEILKPAACAMSTRRFSPSAARCRASLPVSPGNTMPGGSRVCYADTVERESRAVSAVGQQVGRLATKSMVSSAQEV